MGGRQSSNENNELNNNNALNNSQALLNQEDHESKIVVGQPKIKKILAIKNPVYLIKNTLKLEKDEDSPLNEKYYIRFTYDSLVDFELNIIFFCQVNLNVIDSIKNLSGSNNITNNDLYKMYITKQLDSNKQHNLTFSCEKGYKTNFCNNECFFFLDNIKDNINLNSNDANKLNLFDIVIEMVPKVECNEIVAFYTLCNFTVEKSNNNKVSYKLKQVGQKLRAHGMVMEIKEIYNSLRETGECVICFEKNANTILLPCTHSCCSSCAHGLRMRNLGCPICKSSKINYFLC